MNVRQTKLEILLVLVAAGSAMVTAARALFGKFQLGVAVNSPLTAETLFAVCLLALVFMRTRGERGELAEAQSFRWMPLLTALLAITVAFWGSQRVTFLSDDYFVVLDALHGRGAHFFDSLGSDRGDLYYRPVGYTLLWLQALLLGNIPLPWHLFSFAIHLVNCWLLYMLALRSGLAGWMAALAMALFGIHGSRPESVVWITGYFELVSVSFFLGSIVLALHANGPRAKFRYAAAMVCFLAAIWCKESAYILPLILLIFPRTIAESWVARARSVAPFFAIAAVAFLHRWWALGGIGGYLDPASGQPSVANISLIRVVKLLAGRLWAVLFFPINWEVLPGLMLTICILGMCACILFAARSSSQRALIVFSFCAALLGALPASSQLLIGDDLQKSRLLYLPSIGFALLLAGLVNSVESRRLRMLVAATLVTFHVAALQHNLSIWQRVSVMADATCSDARWLTRNGPHEVEAIGLPGTIDGVYFFANGLKECLEMEHGGVWNIRKGSDAGAPSELGKTVLLWNDQTNKLSLAAR